MTTPKSLRAKDAQPARILLVDDHPVVRNGLAGMINRQPGLQVCGEAEDRAEALDVIATCQPDLAIIDLALKTQPGIELVKDIRTRHPQMRILVLSVSDEMIHAERLIRAGASGYITKGEAAAKIVAAILWILDGGIYLSDRVTAQITAKVAGRPQQSAIETLADRELEVFELIGEGFSTQQIAAQLHLGVGTVETYRARIKEKLLLKDSHELLQSAIHWNRSHSP